MGRLGKNSSARIGILGGTFNPIHIGHLILAEQAREYLALDKIIFIPAYIAPHKKNITDIAKASDRLKMLRIAIRDNPYFSVSEIEAQRKGISYSVETLKKLRQIYNNAKFFLLIGADEDIDTWKDTKKIQRICTIVVANRPGYEKRGMQTLSITPLDISSSDIRRRLRLSKSARYLVPDKVYSYIMHKRLYAR